MPVRQGTPRHNEEFTRHDLWVSKSHPEKPTEFLFANLPNIVKDEEVDRADGYRALVQLGRAPRAAARRRQAQLGPAALAGSTTPGRARRS